MEITSLLSIIATSSLLLGLGLTVIAFMRWQHIRNFVHSAEQTEGTIIDSISGGRGNTVTVAEFTDQLGQRHEHRAKIGDGHTAGSSIQILYDLHDPNIAKFNHWLDLYFVSLFLYVFFAVDTIFLATVLFVLALFI